MKFTAPLSSCAWLFLRVIPVIVAVWGLSPASAAGPEVYGKPQQLTAPDQVPEGLPPSDWTSIRAAHQAWQHSFMPVEGRTGVWQARNPGQQWTAQFDGRGFTATPRGRGWTWGLGLVSYGFGGTGQTTVSGSPAVEAEGQRLRYHWDGTVQEWWVNDERGLEHGFTVWQRPAGADGEAPLTFTLSTRGELTPDISPQSVGFQDAAGATVLTYSGLKVWDADGTVLASRFEPAGERTFRLVVEESTARYPITIDPIAQQAYLKPSQVNESDWFGRSVAVSGDTVVVGAMGENSSTTGINSTPDEFALDSGAAYVFVRSGMVWSQQAYLKPAAVGTMQTSDTFGFSVAVSGDTVVVGAPHEDSSTTGSNSTPDEGATNAGAAYVFVRSGTTWSQQAYLKPADVGTTQEDDFFGSAVAVSGDTVVVGAWAEDSSTTGSNSSPNDALGPFGQSGAAYVFVRSGTTWSQQAYLKASQVNAEDNFGWSVAAAGDTVVVGAPHEDSSTSGVNSTPDEGATNAGAAYVFVRSGTAWSQQAYLKPAAVGTTQVDDRFGSAVAVSGDTIVVGAPSEASSTTGINSTPNDIVWFAGAAYVFVRSGTVWSQQAYLKPAAVGITQAGDAFGTSVAVAGNTVVVGAFLEKSSTTGINKTPNENASDAGAAYVFVRSGTMWSQQAYLKPAAVGTTQANEYFGYSVAVSADTVVVGALGEASGTTGIDSTPNEAATNAGAAYVFTGLGPSESAAAYNAWAAGAGLTGPDVATDAVPMGDGVKNLLKYAFNMNGSGPDARLLVPGAGTAGLPSITTVTVGTDHFLQVEYLRRTGSGLVYVPTKSPSLTSASWVPLTATPAVTPIDANWERVVYQEPCDSATSPRLYARVEVTLP